MERPTDALGCNRNPSRIALGMANITEPPTARSRVINILTSMLYPNITRLLGNLQRNLHLASEHLMLTFCSQRGTVGDSRASSLFAVRLSLRHIRTLACWPLSYAQGAASHSGSSMRRART